MQKLSEDSIISFDGVTKDYPLSSLTSGGLKRLLLHFPTHVRSLIHRRYHRALASVSFEVHRGECFGVIGRNGSGKSTLLGLVARVLKPTRGRLSVQGAVIPLLELGAGFHPELSGRENIVLNAILLGMTRAHVNRRMDDIIAFSELEDFIDQPLRVYSSGMTARLGFSVAVHLEPEILLVDEVLSVGDERFREKCLDKMREFRSRQVTILFVSHALESVLEMCDRVALLEAGMLVKVGPAEDVIAAYREREHLLRHVHASGNSS